jgi:hypothetical protein
MNEQERLRLAESFLQEAVFASRAKQAAGASLFGAATNCGLGARAEVVLDLSPRAAEIAREIWPRELDAVELERIQSVTRSWIELQDSLDRKRNHFLKDFRRRHGFERASYSQEQLGAFEDGLAKVNGEAGAQLRLSAASLLA